MRLEEVGISRLTRLRLRLGIRTPGGYKIRDLFVVAVLALLTPALVVLPLPALLRVPLGLVLVLFTPGYALTAAAFPYHADLDNIARIALSFGLSIATIPLLALLLDRLPWGLRPLPIALGLMLWTLFFVLVALVRRALAPPEAVPSTEGLRTWWWTLSRREQVLLGGGGLVVVTLVGLSLAVALNPTPQPLTEFYALGAAGLAEDYPRTAHAGEPLQVTLGITNREGVQANYTVRVLAGEVEVATAGPISLADGATWEQPLSFALPTPGADQPVDIVLLRDGTAEPYRRLRLWVNVTEPLSYRPVMFL